MPSTHDPTRRPDRDGLLDAVEEAGDTFAQLVRTTPASKWTAATPCPDWDVADLVAHVVSVTDGLVPLAHGNGPPRPVDRDDLFGATHTAERLTLGVRRGVEAWAKEDLDAGRNLPWGCTPARRLLEFVLVELVGHGWDLGVATGRRCRMSLRVVATATTMIHEHPASAARQPPSAPVPPADGGLEPLDRFAALLGRQVPPGGPVEAE